MRPISAIATAAVLLSAKFACAQAMLAPAMPDLPQWTSTNLPEWPTVSPPVGNTGAPPARVQPVAEAHAAWSASQAAHAPALPPGPALNGPAMPMLLPPGMVLAGSLEHPINVVHAQVAAPQVPQARAGVAPFVPMPRVDMAYAQSPAAPPAAPDIPLNSHPAPNPSPTPTFAPQLQPSPETAFSQNGNGYQNMPYPSQMPGMEMQPGYQPMMGMPNGQMGVDYDSGCGCDSFGMDGMGCGCQSGGMLLPYGYGGAFASNNRVTSRAGVFLPFWQNEFDTVVFADFRGQWDDQDAGEANLGLGYRMFLDSSWIFGNYIYWDILSTNQDNVFHQATLGFELLSLDWDFRGNITFPGSWDAPAKSSSGISNRTVITQNFQERAYPGFDAEVGHRFLHWGMNDRCEMRWYAGGYYFEHSADGFPSFGGPRGRIEFRIHDLSWLGSQSRMTMGVEGSYDRLNDEQIGGFIRFQIPLGHRSGRPILDPLRRRFVDTPARDID